MYKGIKKFKRDYQPGTNFAERWVGHVACIQEFSRENLKGRNHLEDLDADVKIHLKLILKNYGKVWTA